MLTRLKRAALRQVLGLPTPLLRGLSGASDEPIEGQLLDPQMQAVLAAFGERDDMSRLSPEEARNRMRPGAKIVALSPVAMAEVLDVNVVAVPETSLCVGEEDDHLIEPLRARVYRPRQQIPGAALLYFHGGGGVVGSVDACDAVCRFLASRSRCIVVSLGYRLAPESPFPAAIVDALVAYTWLRAQGPNLGIRPRAIAVGGDSFGANLAMNVSLATMDTGRPRCQLLIYPWVDLACSRPSSIGFAQARPLSAAVVQWFAKHYLGQRAGDDPRASPVRHEGLSGLPPTIIATAGFDPLRDQGRALSDLLEQRQVPCAHRSYLGLPHSFIHYAGVVDEARWALEELAGLLLGELATA
jgi:acetyl esterase/lipase